MFAPRGRPAPGRPSDSSVGTPDAAARLRGLVADRTRRSRLSARPDAGPGHSTGRRRPRQLNDDFRDLLIALYDAGPSAPARPSDADTPACTVDESLPSRIPPLLSLKVSTKTVRLQMCEGG